MSSQPEVDLERKREAGLIYSSGSDFLESSPMQPVWPINQGRLIVGSDEGDVRRGQLSYLLVASTDSGSREFRTNVLAVFPADDPKSALNFIDQPPIVSITKPDRPAYFYWTHNSTAPEEEIASLALLQPMGEPSSPGVGARPSSEKTDVPAAITLLNRWLADESGYDEATWPELKENLEKDRLSSRSLFDD